MYVNQFFSFQFYQQTTSLQKLAIHHNLWIHSLYASRSSGSIFVNDKIIFLFYLFAKKAIRFSFQNLTALLSCCVPKSSIFTCNICTKSRGLFSGYFSAAYAFRTLILLTFGRSFQRVPWQMKSILIIVLFLLVLPQNALVCKGFRGFVKCVIQVASWQNRARWSKVLLPVSSKVGSKTGQAYY